MNINMMRKAVYKEHELMLFLTLERLDMCYVHHVWGTTEQSEMWYALSTNAGQKIRKLYK